MNRPLTAISLLFLLQPLAGLADHSVFTLKDVQGAWWSDCDSPAVEFYISDDTYSGDFIGTHKVMVDNNTLTLSNGLTLGHSVNVSGEPLSFKIISASSHDLVLTPLHSKESNAEWKLYAC